MTHDPSAGPLSRLQPEFILFPNSTHAVIGYKMVPGIRAFQITGDALREDVAACCPVDAAGPMGYSR
jgi:hypothetical protein